MKTIHTLLIKPDQHEYQLPFDAWFLNVFVKPDSNYINIAYQTAYGFDPEIKLVTSTIWTYSTNETIPDNLHYLGSVTLNYSDGEFQRHVFFQNPTFEIPLPSTEPVINQEK